MKIFDMKFDLSLSVFEQSCSDVDSSTLSSQSSNTPPLIRFTKKQFYEIYQFILNENRKLAGKDDDAFTTAELRQLNNYYGEEMLLIKKQLFNLGLA